MGWILEAEPWFLHTTVLRGEVSELLGTRNFREISFAWARVHDSILPTRNLPKVFGFNKRNPGKGQKECEGFGDSPIVAQGQASAPR